jgi:hypothetical protein
MRAHLHQERVNRIGGWINAGHLRVLEDNDPDALRLQIEDQIFAEARKDFPSEQLVAGIALAIHSGMSERNRVRINDYKDSDPLEYARPVAWKRNFERSALLEVGYHNVARITATVKKRRK